VEVRAAQAPAPATRCGTTDRGGAAADYEHAITVNDDPQEPPPPASARLPITVLALGATSFFTDVGSEMIFPLLPAFVASLGASATFLGLVEGAADATASLLKLASGYVADLVPRKKPLVVFGYGIAALVRPLMALATAPWHVLAVRLSDRVGKGLRSSPRDVLIAKAVPPSQAGRAFGLHRAMDHAGAVVGPLLATALLGLGLPLRQVFAVSLLPGLCSLLALKFVRDPGVAAKTAISTPAPAAATPAPAPAPEARAKPALPASFWRYLAIILLFSLGNSSDAFLLLRAHELGVDTLMLPTLWVVLHISKLLSSYLGGALSDRAPRPRLIVLGWTIYAGTYLGLGIAHAAWQVWALFVVYGVYYGLTEPSEKAIIRDIAPPDAQGRAFGLYNFVVGASAVPAGLLTGIVWQSASPRAALALGAGIAAAASLALSAWSPAWRRA
jgi:MFS family permease